MKDFLKYTIIWVSRNLAIAFWVIGHVHLTLNVYEDLHELIISFGMNILVGIGFYLDYKEQKKNKN